VRDRVSQIAGRHNVSLACWEDGLYKGDGRDLNRSQLSTDGGDVFSYAWNNVWQYGNARRAHELANAGFKVSRSPSLSFVQTSWINFKYFMRVGFVLGCFIR